MHEQETVLIYCATSKCSDRQVDHIFDANSDNEALEFAKAHGWYFVEQAQTEIVLTLDKRVLN